MNQTDHEREAFLQELKELDIPQPHKEVLTQSLELDEPQTFRHKFNFVKKLIVTRLYTQDSTLFNAAIEMLAKENNKVSLRSVAKNEKQTHPSVSSRSVQVD